VAAAHRAHDDGEARGEHHLMEELHAAEEAANCVLSGRTIKPPCKSSGSITNSISA